MELNRTKNSLRNSFSGIINKCVNLLMPFIIRTIMIQKLGQEYLGLSSLFTAIIQVLNLSELGIGTALVFNMYKPVAEKDYPMLKSLVTVYRKVYRIIGAVVLVIGLAITPFLTYIIDMSALEGTNINVYVLFFIYLANTVLTYLFFAYRKSLFMAYQRQDVVSRIDTVVHMLMFLVQIVLIYVTRNYYIYIIMMPLFTFIDNGIAALASRKYFPHIDQETKTPPVDVKSILGNIRYLIGHRVGAVIINSGDSIIISAFLPMLTLTIYSNYFYVVTALAGFINVGYNAISAGIGNSLITKSKEENYALFNDLTYILFYIVSFSSIAMFNLYQPFMRIWMGDGLMFGINTVALFTAYFYTWQIRVMGLNFKEAGGMWKNDWIKPYVGMVVNLVMNFVLVQMIGVDGVLISTIVVMTLVYFPWETHVLHKDMFCVSCKPYVLKFLYYFVVTLIGCAACHFLCGVIAVEGIWGLLLKGAAVVIAGNVLMILLTYKMMEFKHVVRRMNGLWKRKVQG